MNRSRYTYERDSGVWVVVEWRDGNAGGRVGETISSHILKSDARREAYRLNGRVDYRLEFSYNWNGKLNGKAFTSIRLWNEKKYVQGREYVVYLKDFRRGRVKLISIKRMRLNNINEHIARLDTGYSAIECRDIIRKMYKNRQVNWETQYLAYLLFAYVNEEKVLL